MVSPVLFAFVLLQRFRHINVNMNTVQILVFAMAACCASQGRNIRVPPPEYNQLDIHALLAHMKNPVIMKGFGRGNSQQQQQLQPQQQQQQGAGQIPQAEVTPQSAPNEGQLQPEPLSSLAKSKTPPVTQPTQVQVQVQTPVQNAGQGQQGQSNNGQTQQIPVPAPSVGIPKTLDPMQQFMGYSNRFTDPMFLQYFQRFMRRVNRRMKPKYRKGDFIPRKGLFPGGYVISADGSDAEVRDIYGKLHSIDGGVFQS